MNGNNGYAVFFFPQALEALGEAIKPYLQDGPAGPHVMCNGVDTGGAFMEISLNGTTRDGTAVELELMVPTGMVRMIVSAHSDEMFGFGPHALKGAVQKVAAVTGEAGVVAEMPAAAAEQGASEAPAVPVKAETAVAEKTPEKDVVTASGEAASARKEGA